MHFDRVLNFKKIKQGISTSVNLLKYEAFMAFKESDYPTAITKTTQQLKETPNDAVALSNLGVFQRAANKHRDALGEPYQIFGCRWHQSIDLF